jgi:hypothetical protein
LHPPSAKAYEKLPRLLEHLFKSLWILLRHNDTRVRQASSRT